MNNYNKNDYKVYDSFPCAAVIFRTDGTREVVYANPIYKTMFPDEKFINIYEDDRRLFELEIENIYKPTKLNVRIRNIYSEIVPVCAYIVRIEEGLALAAVVDDTENVTARQKIEKEYLRYIEAIGASGEVLFEYDCQKDEVMFFFASAENHTIETRTVTDFIERLSDDWHIEDKDKSILRKLKRTGIKREETFDIRMKMRGSKVFEWFRIVISPSHKENVFSGSARNIDGIKKKEDILRRKALIDPLSKVYNRAAATEKIRERQEKMGKYEECALIVIDIDNFKHINDTFGHLYGDAVIAMAAGSIKSTLEKDDIMGRFGGDEFFIYTNNAERRMLERKLESIRLAVLKMRFDKNDENDISCSMGVSIAHSGTAYEEMFRQADSALYTAKANGKNRFEFFNGQYQDNFSLSYAGVTGEARDENESNEAHDITAVALEIASKSVSTESAVSNLMRHIGIALDLDCIQIMTFDTIEDKVYLQFQWWKENSGQYNVVFTESKSGYYVHNDLTLFRDRLHKDKIFQYTPDFKEGFSMKYRDVFENSENINMVYSSNNENEEKFQVITYQSWDKERVWKQAELDDMFEITKIISMFMKSAQIMSEREKRLEEMVDYSRYGLYSQKRFGEEAGRISREALNSSDKVAVIHFDFKHFYKFNRTYGSDEGDRVMEKFGDFLRQADSGRAINAFIEGTDVFITLFRYNEKYDVRAVIEEELRQFCEQCGEYKEYPLIIKAGLCYFKIGQSYAKAIEIAKELKHGVEFDSCACIAEEMAEEKAADE